MSDKFTAEILDIERIYALVDELREVDRNRAIRSGLLRGARILQRVGRRNLRLRNDEHTGNLIKSMRAKLVRRELKAFAGFERSYRLRLEKGVGNHAHLVDRGTGPRFTKKGYYRGIMPASYFWTDTKEQSKSAVSQEIEKAIEKMVEILKRKYAT